jgi:TIR domain
MLKRAQELQASGLETFIDVLTLRSGDKWDRKIFAAIDDCDLFVVIWSRNARDSQWVKKESHYALKRYKKLWTSRLSTYPCGGASHSFGATRSAGLPLQR